VIISGGCTCSTCSQLDSIVDARTGQRILKTGGTLIWVDTDSRRYYAYAVNADGLVYHDPRSPADKPRLAVIKGVAGAIFWKAKED
jgi:hypothetical protein